MSRASFSEARFGRFALLFLAIPILLLAAVGSHTQYRFEDHLQRRKMLSMENRLDRGIAATSRTFCLLSMMSEYLHRVRRLGLDSPALEKELARIRKRFQLPLKAYFYRKGELIRSFPAGDEHDPVFRVLLSALLLKGEARNAAQRDLKDPIMKIFGPGSRLELMQTARGKVGRALSGEHRGAYFWEEFRNGLGVFFFIKDVPGAAKRFNSLVRKRMPCIGAAEPDRRLWLPPLGIPPIQMEIAWKKALSEGRATVVHAGFEWIFARNRYGFLWCCAQRSGEGEKGSGIGFVVGLGYTVSGILLLIYLLGSFQFGTGLDVIHFIDSLPIRTRLLSLFATATILPLGMALLLGSIVLFDKREVLQTEATRAGLERLNTLEQGYRGRLEKLERLSKALRARVSSESEHLEAVHEELKDLVEALELRRFEVRDPHGKAIISNLDENIHGLSQAQELFGRVAVRKHAPHRLGDQDRMSAAEIVSESILSTDEAGMATLLRERARLWTFRAGTSPAFWYWDVFPELSTGPAFIAITHQMDDIYRAQVHSTFLPAGSGEKPRQLALEISEELGSLSTIPFIREKGIASLRRAAVRSMETGRILFREVELGGKTYWATIKPETSISFYIFIDLVPVEAQLATLAPIRWKLVFGAALSLLMAFLGASLLASLFIIPIADLANGIDSIRRRDDRFRIPIRRRDEFGALATAFNTLLGDMKELQYGRIVQESLLPAHPKTPEGYEVAFLRRTANDLAGDYHDAVNLEEGTFGLILGDVTGHGISAALAMAMAKATVDYQKVARWTFPAQVLDKLNALFYRELKPRQKFMTLGCVLLKPETHELVFENAGHPYPLHFEARTGRAHEFQMPSLPLGARAKRRTGPLAGTLSPGDAIILYTDGFVECTSERGEVFGYPRFSELFARSMRESRTLDEVMEKLNRAFDSFRVPGPLQDDVTIVLLRRRS